jgi:DNA-binding beta-propeller fold protein YncE
VIVYVGPTARISARGTVTPIDAATGTALKRITVGGDGGPIAITPNGKTAYVVGGCHRVTPIDTTANTAGQPIRVGRFPAYMAITP